MVVHPWATSLFIPEQAALRERQPLMGPDHTIRGMFLTSTIECLRRDVGPDAVSAVLRETNTNPDNIGAMRKHPLTEFNELRTAVAKALVERHGSWESAVTRIGAACVEIFFESVAGRTMMLLAGKDPHRLMTAAPNGYSLGVADAGTRTYTKTGPNSGRFDFTHDLLGPCHEIGTFSSAIRAVCGIEIVVEVEQKTLLDFKLHVTWTG